MKHILLFVIAVLFAAAITILYTAPSVPQTPQHIITPVATQSATMSSFSLQNAPSESIRGNIATLSGTVNWESRTATQPAKLIPPETFQQGELLQTGDDGNITVNFPNVAKVQLSPKAQVNFVQMLPTASVMSQDYGTSEYIKAGNTPISVRVMQLLLEIDGDAIVSVNADTDEIVVDVQSGSITAAYNDLQYLSNVVPVSAGNEFTFDDDTREENVVPLSGQ